MTERPRIAVVADRKVVTAGAWKDIPTDGLPHSYLTAIETAGGLPILFPSLDVALAGASSLLDLVDGLFLPGGRDIDAELYGADSHEQNDAPLRIRDELEIELVRHARRRNMPIFGACRGMQIINVAFGGTLTQHLAEVTELTPHRDVVGEFTKHPVQVTPNTLLASLAPQSEFSIASHHHQSVQDLGRHLVASAIAPDGIVEALEAPEGSFCLGVQWHPEEQLDVEGLNLIRAFIDEARRYSRR